MINLANLKEILLAIDFLMVQNITTAEINKYLL